MDSSAITSEIGTVAVEVGNPLTELGLATLFIIIIIALHGWLLGRVSNLFSSRHALYTPRTPRWRVGVLTTITIALLVMIHLGETLLWTVPMRELGILPGFRDTYYFVLESYTTLGAGVVTLPMQWRLFGPAIAISGLFTFGWTASVLVYVMTESGKLQAARARAAASHHVTPPTPPTPATPPPSQ